MEQQQLSRLQKMQSLLLEELDQCDKSDRKELVSELKNEEFKSLYGYLLLNDGFTVNNEFKHCEEKGYFVGLPKNETKIPLQFISFELFVEIMNNYQKTDNYIGVWINNGLVHFDYSVLIKDLKSAINQAIDNNQMAIFDNEQKETLFVLEQVEQGLFEITV